ncbi:MAG TPA: MFS transporter [Stellaceae bacterium]|nr:MFS transporter [Stellaceae bacterium]
MTEATETSRIATGRAQETRIIALICGAHFVSHVYIIALPPLFFFIRAEYGVSYSELGLVVALFNVVSTVLQAPAGFLVDRMAPAMTLVLALALGASGLALAGAVPLWWALIAGWGLAGVANTIYHPADYAILSDAVETRRIGQAFSLHTFFGMVGTAATPATMLFLATVWGWRGAMIGAAALGYAVALVLLVQRRAFTARAASRPRRNAEKVGWNLLLSPPILRNVLFFALLAAAGSGISNFSIVALGALQGTALGVANFALSSYLAMNAAGVLAGGYIASRTRRHDRVAVAGFAASGFLVLLIGLVPLGGVALVALMGSAGFLNGIIQPSRDMIVRAVTPEGSFGKVFGFVSMGFSIGGVIAPLIYGWLMDLNEPRLVFLVAVGFTVLALPLVRVPAAGTKASSAARP